MATHWPNKPGINHVGEFQVAGHTLAITGSAETIYLTHVASSITLSADGADKEVTFFDGGHTGIAFTVPQDTTTRFKGKFLTFKVPAGADALVEITNIPSSSYNPPTFAQLHRTANGGLT